MAGLLSGAGVYNSRLSHSTLANFSISSVDKRPNLTSLMRLPPPELGSTRRGRAGVLVLRSWCAAVLYCSYRASCWRYCSSTLCAAVSFVTMVIASLSASLRCFLRASLAATLVC